MHALPRDAHRTRRPRGGAIAWLPAAAWAGVIFAASARPDLRFMEDPLLDLLVRKAGHATVFGILALLVWLAVARTTALRPAWAWAAAAAAFYAVTDELHQGVVPGRHASPVDVAIDTTGALLAVALLRWLLRARAARGGGGWLG